MSASAEAGAGSERFSCPELERLFAPLASFGHFALAVSGGSDSMALMRLVWKWRRHDPAGPDAVTVLTVDHRLRPASASEARWVGKRAAALGFSHHTLVWDGPKPAAAIQASARAARYDLMTRFCRERGIPAIATAHTRDDQAETLLMRLARGSGVDGLSGMPERSRRGGLALIRPLLGVSRARLRAFLEAEGCDWLDDPTNKDERFERPRLRKALEAAEALGLSREKLALSAMRLGRARLALEDAAAAFLRANIAVGEAGYGRMRISALLGAPEETGLRALARMTLAFGGQAGPPRLAKIEAAYRTLKSGGRSVTLAGCRFLIRPDELTVSREYGRMPRAGIAAAPGSDIRWDGRFKVSVPASAGSGLTLRPLGLDGLQSLKAAKARIPDAPRPAAAALPSLWRGGALCFAPFVSFERGAPEGWEIGASAYFTGAGALFESAWAGAYPPENAGN